MRNLKLPVKRTVALLLVVSLIVLFYKLLEELFIVNIVNPILSKVESNFLNDTILILFLIYVFYKLIRNLQHKTHVSFLQVLFDVVVLIFYLFIRLFKNFEFQELSIFNPIKYLDLIFSFFLLSPITAIANILLPRKKVRSTVNELFNDDPIKNKSQDLLNRNYKAQRLTEDIFQLTSEGSVAFGISGEWGSGKTSFLNLVKDEIIRSDDNNSFIVVDFRPWLNLTIESIVKDFFDTIRSAIKPFSQSIGHDINHYSKSLLKADKYGILDAVSKLFDFSEKQNLTIEFEAINLLLERLGKRIVICIDDFDRLQPNEIFEFLKLIRSSASFNGFTYLVAFDKAYLIESLKNLGIPKSEYFSEKIFLKEERLTPITSDQIMGFVHNSLKPHFGKDNQSLTDYFEKRDARVLIKASNFSPLRHIRDGKRFLNSFLTDYKSIYKEVDFEDYFNLKLLKYSYYDAYASLFLFKRRFLSLESGVKSSYKIKYESEGGIQNRFRDFKTSELGKHLADSFDYNEEDVNNAGKLLKDLFDVNNYLPKNHLSISYPQNYHKYFLDNLNDNDLSEDEFLKVLRLKIDKIKDKIDKWHEANKTTNVSYRFQDLEIKDIPGLDMYENAIKAIVYLAKLEVENAFSRRTYMGYDYNDLANKIKDREGILTKRFYSQNRTPKEFLIQLFDSAESPYLVETDLLNHMYSDFDHESYPLSRDEIKSQLIGYFKKFHEKQKNFDFNAWLLFHNCKVKRWHGEGNGPFTSETFYFDEAKEIMKEFIKIDLDKALVDFIDVQPFYGSKESDNKIGISKGVLNIFESYDDLLNFIGDQNTLKALKKPSKFKDEFLDFGNKLKDNNYEMIAYEFQYQAILEKLDSITRQYNR
ncbi:KAP family P-loop NTPase fold protein [Croceivirga thetidis]|uniref:KAP NTPase domain-containing protein n=1 Tax=Croceivirga thetidis TaxID=2721623 RepID=A0ABX1GNY8_9FLAO|nr:P-loop NTPase fold protein [Croceivirga thetidis]NKI30775.1 hypothetical protein [Croceivirga thetidis]